MIEKLLEYQKIDASLKEIENNLKKSEEFKKYAQAVKFLKTVTDSKTQMESKAASLVSVLNALKDRMEKLNEDKNEFSSIGDIDNEDTLAFLKKKSQELSKSYENLENEMEKLSNEMKELYDSYKKLMDSTKVMIDQQKEYKQKYEQLCSACENEKNAIKQKLDVIAKDIPEEYLNKYNEKRKDPKFPIVYKMEGKHCSACGTELSQLELSRLKNEKIIECENCRRLIVIAE